MINTDATNTIYQKKIFLHEWLLFFPFLFNSPTMKTNTTLSHLFWEDKNMKTIPYSRLARMLTGSYQWWEINHSQKTNQKYAYYFSCSGHGWFVVSYDMLTPKQKENLINFYKWEENIKFDYVAYDALTNKAKAWCRYNAQSTRFNNVRFVCFEEDCAWAIAYAILWISNEDIVSIGKEKADECATQTINKYYKN